MIVHLFYFKAFFSPFNETGPDPDDDPNAVMLALSDGEENVSIRPAPIAHCN